MNKSSSVFIERITKKVCLRIKNSKSGVYLDIKQSLDDSMASDEVKFVIMDEGEECDENKK